jgi:hypothetical protein
MNIINIGGDIEQYSPTPNISKRRLTSPEEEGSATKRAEMDDNMDTCLVTATQKVSCPSETVDKTFESILKSIHKN